MTKNWSILIVNYKSHIYLKWQLKIIYEFNNPDDFNLIIVDNSADKEEAIAIDRITSPYVELYKNIKITYHIPAHKAASGQHGEAIDLAKNHINTKYTLIHDPDFFWLKKDYLKWLESLLVNHDAVGSPYSRPVALGQKYFPSAFGCAYITDKIKDISFAAYLDDDIEKSWDIFNNSDFCKQGYEFYYDVGWRVRKKLSDKKGLNFISFFTKEIKNELIKILNIDKSHSFETLTSLYYWNCQVIAAHLFRGSFTGKVKSHCDPKLEIDNEQYILRDKIGELMYLEIKNGCLQLNNINNILNSDAFDNLPFKLLALKLILCLKRIRTFKMLIPIKTSYLKKKINNYKLQ